MDESAIGFKRQIMEGFSRGTIQRDISVNISKAHKKGDAVAVQELRALEDSFYSIWERDKLEAANFAADWAVQAAQSGAGTIRSMGAGILAEGGILAAQTLIATAATPVLGDEALALGGGVVGAIRGFRKSLQAVRRAKKLRKKISNIEDIDEAILLSLKEGTLTQRAGAHLHNTAKHKATASRWLGSLAVANEFRHAGEGELISDLMRRNVDPDTAGLFVPTFGWMYALIEVATTMLPGTGLPFASIAGKAMKSRIAGGIAGGGAKFAAGSADKEVKARISNVIAGTIASYVTRLTLNGLFESMEEGTQSLTQGAVVRKVSLDFVNQIELDIENGIIDALSAPDIVITPVADIILSSLKATKDALGPSFVMVGLLGGAGDIRGALEPTEAAREAARKRFLAADAQGPEAAASAQAQDAAEAIAEELDETDAAVQDKSAKQQVRDTLLADIKLRGIDLDVMSPEDKAAMTETLRAHAEEVLSNIGLDINDYFEGGASLEDLLSGPAGDVHQAAFDIDALVEGTNLAQLPEEEIEAKIKEINDFIDEGLGGFRNAYDEAAAKRAKTNKVEVDALLPGTKLDILKKLSADIKSGKVKEEELVLTEKEKEADEAIEVDQLIASLNEEISRTERIAEEPATTLEEAKTKLNEEKAGLESDVLEHGPVSRVVLTRVSERLKEIENELEELERGSRLTEDRLKTMSQDAKDRLPSLHKRRTDALTKRNNIRQRQAADDSKKNVAKIKELNDRLKLMRKKPDGSRPSIDEENEYDKILAEIASLEEAEAVPELTEQGAITLKEELLANITEEAPEQLDVQIKLNELEESEDRIGRLGTQYKKALESGEGVEAAEAAFSAAVDARTKKLAKFESISGVNAPARLQKRIANILAQSLVKDRNTYQKIIETFPGKVPSGPEGDVLRLSVKRAKAQLETVTQQIDDLRLGLRTIPEDREGALPRPKALPEPAEGSNVVLLGRVYRDTETKTGGLVVAFRKGVGQLQRGLRGDPGLFFEQRDVVAPSGKEAQSQADKADDLDNKKLKGRIVGHLVRQTDDQLIFSNRTSREASNWTLNDIKIPTLKRFVELVGEFIGPNPLGKLGEREFTKVALRRLDRMKSLDPDAPLMGQLVEEDQVLLLEAAGRLADEEVVVYTLDRKKWTTSAQEHFETSKVPTLLDSEGKPIPKTKLVPLQTLEKEKGRLVSFVVNTPGGAVQVIGNIKSAVVRRTGVDTPLNDKEVSELVDFSSGTPTIRRNLSGTVTIRLIQVVDREGNIFDANTNKNKLQKSLNRVSSGQFINKTFQLHLIKPPEELAHVFADTGRALKAAEALEPVLDATRDQVETARYRMAKLVGNESEVKGVTALLEQADDKHRAKALEIDRFVEGNGTYVEMLTALTEAPAKTDKQRLRRNTAQKMLDTYYDTFARVFILGSSQSSAQVSNEVLKQNIYKQIFGVESNLVTDPATGKILKIADVRDRLLAFKDKAKLHQVLLSKATFGLGQHAEFVIRSIASGKIAVLDSHQRIFLINTVDDFTMMRAQTLASSVVKRLKDLRTGKVSKGISHVSYISQHATDALLDLMRMNAMTDIMAIAQSPEMMFKAKQGNDHTIVSYIAASIRLGQHVRRGEFFAKEGRDENPAKNLWKNLTHAAGKTPTNEDVGQLVTPWIVQRWAEVLHQFTDSEVATVGSASELLGMVGKVPVKTLVRKTEEYRRAISDKTFTVDFTAKEGEVAPRSKTIMVRPEGFDSEITTAEGAIRFLQSTISAIYFTPESRRILAEMLVPRVISDMRQTYDELPSSGFIHRTKGASDSNLAETELKTLSPGARRYFAGVLSIGSGNEKLIPFRGELMDAASVAKILGMKEDQFRDSIIEHSQEDSDRHLASDIIYFLEANNRMPEPKDMGFVVSPTKENRVTDSGRDALRGEMNAAVGDKLGFPSLSELFESLRNAMALARSSDQALPELWGTLLENARSAQTRILASNALGLGLKLFQFQPSLIRTSRLGGEEKVEINNPAAAISWVSGMLSGDLYRDVSPVAQEIWEMWQIINSAEAIDEHYKLFLDDKSTPMTSLFTRMEERGKDDKNTWQRSVRMVRTGSSHFRTLINNGQVDEFFANKAVTELGSTGQVIDRPTGPAYAEDLPEQPLEISVPTETSIGKAPGLSLEREVEMETVRPVDPALSATTDIRQARRDYQFQVDGRERSLYVSFAHFMGKPRVRSEQLVLDELAMIVAVRWSPGMTNSQAKNIIKDADLEAISVSRNMNRIEVSRIHEQVWGGQVKHMRSFFGPKETDINLSVVRLIGAGEYNALQLINRVRNKDLTFVGGFGGESKDVRRRGITNYIYKLIRTGKISKSDAEQYKQALEQVIHDFNLEQYLDVVRAINLFDRSKHGALESVPGERRKPRIIGPLSESMQKVQDEVDRGVGELTKTLAGVKAKGLTDEQVVETLQMYAMLEEQAARSGALLTANLEEATPGTGRQTRAQRTGETIIRGQRFNSQDRLIKTTEESQPQSAYFPPERPPVGVVGPPIEDTRAHKKFGVNFADARDVVIKLRDGNPITAADIQTIVEADELLGGKGIDHLNKAVDANGRSITGDKMVVIHEQDKSTFGADALGISTFLEGEADSYVRWVTLEENTNQQVKKEAAAPMTLQNVNKVVESHFQASAPTTTPQTTTPQTQEAPSGATLSQQKRAKKTVEATKAEEETSTEGKGAEVAAAPDVDWGASRVVIQGTGTDVDINQLVSQEAVEELSEIQAIEHAGSALPGSVLTESEDGKLIWRIGDKLLVVDFRREIGTKKGLFVAGRLLENEAPSVTIGGKTLNADGTILLATRYATDKTLYHEAFEFAYRNLLTPEDQEVIMDEYGQPGRSENEAIDLAAEAYADYKPQTRAHVIFEKLLALFRALVRYGRGRTSTDVFQELQQARFTPTPFGVTNETSDKDRTFGGFTEDDVRAMAYAPMRRLFKKLYSRQKVTIPNKRAEMLAYIVGSAKGAGFNSVNAGLIPLESRDPGQNVIYKNHSQSHGLLDSLLGGQDSLQRQVLVQWNSNFRNMMYSWGNHDETSIPVRLFKNMTQGYDKQQAIETELHEIIKNGMQPGDHKLLKGLHQERRKKNFMTVRLGGRDVQIQVASALKLYAIAKDNEAMEAYTKTEKGEPRKVSIHLSGKAKSGEQTTDVVGMTKRELLALVDTIDKAPEHAANRRLLASYAKVQDRMGNVLKETVDQFIDLLGLYGAKVKPDPKNPSVRIATLTPEAIEALKNSDIDFGEIRSFIKVKNHTTIHVAMGGGFAGPTGDITLFLKNAGLMKSRVPRSSGREDLYVPALDAEMFAQIRQVSKIAGLMIPLFEFRRVAIHPAVSHRLKEVFGKRYHDDLIKHADAIEGKISNYGSDLEKYVDWGASRVVIQGLVAPWTMAKMLLSFPMGANRVSAVSRMAGLRHVASAMAPGFLNRFTNTESRSEMMAHPFYQMRYMYGFRQDPSVTEAGDVAVSPLLTTLPPGEGGIRGAAARAWKSKGTSLIKTPDEIALSILWSASENAVREEQPNLQGKELWAAVGERWTEVVRQTQPVSEITEVSNLLADRSGVKKLLMFYGQRTQMINQLLMSWDKAKQATGIEARKAARSDLHFDMVNILFVNASVMTAIGGFRAMIRDMWGDDDEPDERSMIGFFGSWASGVVKQGVSLFPVVSDVAEVFTAPYRAGQGKLYGSVSKEASRIFDSAKRISAAGKAYDEATTFAQMDRADERQDKAIISMLGSGARTTFWFAGVPFRGGKQVTDLLLVGKQELLELFE